MPIVHTVTTAGGNQRSTVSSCVAPPASRKNAHCAKKAGQ